MSPARSAGALAAKLVAGNTICLAAVLVCTGNAAADEPPEIPANPAAPVTPASPRLPVRGALPWEPAQGAALSILGGVSTLPDLSGGPLGEMLLPQTPVPAAPGDGPIVLPGLNPLNNRYLLPQYLEPSVPGEGQVFGVEPDQLNADIRRRDYLRRLYETYRAGGLKGGLLGQKPREEHGEQFEDSADQSAGPRHNVTEPSHLRAAPPQP